MITTALTDTPLTKAVTELRAILSANTLLQTLLADSLRPTEPIIKNVPLNYASITSNYSVSCYHQCNEQVIEENNGITIIQAPIFIDVHKKVNSKEYAIIFDELDKFSRTVLAMLYDQDTHKSLNASVTEWKLHSKNLWRPETTGSVKVEKEQLYNYITQITLIVEYSVIYSTYY